MLTPLSLAYALYLGYNSSLLIIIGLSLFAIVFAVNSAVHSYLIVEWAEHDKVSMNVGFYYMANAGGRLVGTILSGLVFQFYGLIGCLITAALFIASAAVISRRLN
jgi:predicted MFS family arabinose efflux permease